MGERKVVNKFVPWDFDPDKVAKVKLSNIGQFSVRMMLPFTVRCSKCGEFNYQGRKYNTRKETAAGEDYLGIAIQRFYFKCTNCGGEFTIKTDPKNSTYVVESGLLQQYPKKLLRDLRGCSIPAFSSFFLISDSSICPIFLMFVEMERL